MHLYTNTSLENILAKWPSKAINKHSKGFLHDNNMKSSQEGIEEILSLLPPRKKKNTYCEAIKSRAVLKQILQPDDSVLLKQQVLLIHLGLSTLIPSSKFH